MIYLIEKNKDKFGHFYLYLNSLLKIRGTKALQIPSTTRNSKRYLKIFDILQYYSDLRKQLLAVPKGNIAHILYADIYYKIPLFSSSLLKRNKTIVTMHSCPNGKLKHFLMKNFCKRVEAVVVHSDYIKHQMETIGLKNVICIDYPSFYDYTKVETKNNLRRKYQIADDCIIFSALGGIRQDKGLDILLNAFKYIDDKHKNKIILNVAGRACSFLDEGKITETANKYKINTRLTIRPLTDAEFMENVIISDYMVMPYRGNMTGNSGPMTEAIVNGIPSIVPANTNLGIMAIDNHVGLTFIQENEKSLAEALISACDNKYVCDDNYCNRLTEETFLSKYKKLYENIMQ